MKKVMIIALSVIALLFTANVYAAKDQKGASEQAMEHASDEAVFNRVGDWFATIGKSKEEKARIKAERKVERARKKAQKKAKNMKKDSGDNAEKMQKKMKEQEKTMKKSSGEDAEKMQKKMKEMEKKHKGSGMRKKGS